MNFSTKAMGEFLRVFLILMSLFVVSPSIQAAATIVIDNFDGPGVGFNDTTAAASVGGNSGTTIGEQRLIAINYAAQLVGNLLPSGSPDIHIGAKFTNLGDCVITPEGYLSVVLGGAGPITVHSNFTGANGLSPLADTWYPAAVANAIHGSDLCQSGDSCDIFDNSFTGIPADEEAGSLFNSALDTAGTVCKTYSVRWYYGLDGNFTCNPLDPACPFLPDPIDFVTIAFHELIHAVGFLSLIDVSTGQLFMDESDDYSIHVEDHNSGQLLPNMSSDTERLSALTSGSALHWTSPNVVDANNGNHMRLYAPDPVEVGSTLSHFDLGTNEVMEPAYYGPNHEPGKALPLLSDLYVQVGCTISEPSESSCSDLLDNDCDGLIDGDDLDCPQPCVATQVTEMNCLDGVDNDCNGSTDGDDPNCQLMCPTSSCVPTQLPAETSCNDGLDNDCDGAIDAADTDCQAPPPPPPTCDLAQVGDSCTVNGDCCSNKCKGPTGRKTCR